MYRVLHPVPPPATPLPLPARPGTESAAPAEHIAAEEPEMTATDQVGLWGGGLQLMQNSSKAVIAVEVQFTVSYYDCSIGSTLAWRAFKLRQRVVSQGLITEELMRVCVVQERQTTVQPCSWGGPLSEDPHSVSAE